MANKKITELDAATSLASTDVLGAVDVSEDVTKQVTTTNLFRTLPDGTAAAPALAFSSDAANGVYLAGTDTVGISTGGTQRVTVDGSGNVSISGDLTVSGATTTVESTTVTIDDKNIELGSVASPSNTTADGGGITLKGASDKTLKWINSTGCWTFNQPMNFNDHVRIDSSGNVGIGETSPVSKLIIKNTSSNDGIRIISSTTGEGFLLFGDTADNNTGGLVYSHTNDALEFNVNNSERMRIDSSGRLLVGTSSDISGGSNHSLIQCASSAGGQLALGRNDSTVSNNDGLRLIRFFGNDGGSYQEAARIECRADGSHALGDKPGRLTFHTTADNASSTTERMRIDSSGNVGIGTTSPQEQLHVSGTSDFVVDTTGSTVRLGSYGEHDIALVTGRSTPSLSTRVTIENGNGEAARIDS